MSERDEFERVTQGRMNHQRCEHDRNQYWSGPTYHAWKGWQARADLAAEREQQLVEALRMAEGHLEEMRKDPRHHPIGHCPILDHVRDTLATHNNEGEL